MDLWCMLEIYYKKLFISFLLNFNTHNEEDIDMTVNCSVIAIFIFNAPYDFRHCSAFQNFLVIHVDAVIPNSVLHAMLLCLSVCLIQLWLFCFSSLLERPKCYTVSAPRIQSHHIDLDWIWNHQGQKAKYRLSFVMS
jgi:hypothetical protein